MNVLVLILTNAASFLGGAVACWWLTVHVIDLKEKQVSEDGEPGGNGLTWLVIGLIVMGMAAIGLLGQWQHKQTSDCLSEYLSGSAPLAAERDAATQKLWDDFASFQHIGPNEADKIADLRQTFFEDLAAERAADDALQAYREAHAEDEVCPR